ncbi:hypothetical protein I5Q34_29680 [Streptomyces sp. AV19]|uniref:hypothetical protein n=1 Tax=Streptomyces sp. AV19 TaxID=2793068 RepID=UPI0018FE3FA3|nr:hypothetical protein [Streptomyces sp. AV19]MBH1938380.1 hypothetical protein [Streptomyces sp. AV19]MDG4535029.1 hypothetical protein [Streptomyces sp. AV19]
MPLPNPCEENHHKITIVMTTDPGNVADGDRLWDSYFAYLKNGHGQCLIAYTLTKGPESVNPFDPRSPVTDRTMYTLDECYPTGPDITRHWEQLAVEWEDFGAAFAWTQRPNTQIVILQDGLVVHSLWKADDVP